MDRAPASQVDISPIEGYYIIPNGIPTSTIVFRTQQICDILKVTPGQLRGWISRGLFPARDGELNDKNPVWALETIVEYVRNAPGGRLGYPVD